VLFVLDAEFDQIQRGLRQSPFQPQVQGRVDVATVGQHGFQAGPLNRPAQRTRMARSDGVVIGVEEKAVALVEGLVAGIAGPEDELFKEPAGVGEVPLRGLASSID